MMEDDNSRVLSLISFFHEGAGTAYVGNSVVSLQSLFRAP